MAYTNTRLHISSLLSRLPIQMRDKELFYALTMFGLDSLESSASAPNFFCLHYRNAHHLIDEIELFSEKNEKENEKENEDA